VFSRNTSLGKEEIWLADVHTGVQTKLISDGIMPQILP
jgi:hypothetical protein